MSFTPDKGLCPTSKIWRPATCWNTLERGTLGTKKVGPENDLKKNV